MHALVLLLPVRLLLLRNPVSTCCMRSAAKSTGRIFGAQFEADKEAAATEAFARLIWDTALLESGFDIEAPKEFNARVYELLARAHGIAPADLAMSEESAAAAAAEVRLIRACCLIFHFCCASLYCCCICAVYT